MKEPYLLYVIFQSNSTIDGSTAETVLQYGGDRVISVRVMSDVTEVKFKQTTETHVMAFGREGIRWN
jgi:hypothetical protein